MPQTNLVGKTKAKRQIQMNFKNKDFYLQTFGADADTVKWGVCGGWGESHGRFGEMRKKIFTTEGKENGRRHTMGKS